MFHDHFSVDIDLYFDEFLLIDLQFIIHVGGCLEAGKTSFGGVVPPMAVYPYDMQREKFIMGTTPHLSDVRCPAPSQFKTYGGWFTTVTLRALAHHPDVVEVAEHCLRSGTILEVSCHPDDQEQLMGEGRCIAQALHTFLHALGGREGEDYVLRTVPLGEVEWGEEDGV